MASLIFSADFTDADAALTPNPYTGTTISAGNDCKLSATNPITGSNDPCEECDFGGSSANCNGFYTLPTDLDPRYKAVFIGANWGCTVLPYPGNTGNANGLIGLRTASGMFASIEYYKNGAADPRFRLKYSIDSTTAVGTTVVAANTNYNMKLVLDASVPTNATFSLLVNNAVEATLTGKNIVDLVRTARWGGQGVAGNPANTVKYYMDNCTLGISGNRAVSTASGCSGHRLSGVAKSISVCGFCSIALMASAFPVPF